MLPGFCLRFEWRSGRDHHGDLDITDDHDLDAAGDLDVTANTLDLDAPDDLDIDDTPDIDDIDFNVTAAHVFDDRTGAAYIHVYVYVHVYVERTGQCGALVGVQADRQRRRSWLLRPA